MTNKTGWKAAAAAVIFALCAAHSYAAEVKTSKANTGMVTVVPVGEGSDLVLNIPVDVPEGAYGLRGVQFSAQVPKIGWIGGGFSGRVTTILLVNGEEVWDQTFYADSDGEPIVLAGSDRVSITGPVTLRVRFFNDTEDPVVMRGAARVAFVVPTAPSAAEIE